ncbi:CHAT domain-containing protein [Suillus subaureus]|uniref:CHAT domain-containing protein n=1 Tax=Suillus subaureus TaxID=48587 RepID=A0A9P7JF60_9AGAM|nr:CHAT domain-containing protein [Suillus subaureus]KAG1818644.1 CHAT domain-containing protein [Suillus subaureus]
MPLSLIHGILLLVGDLLASALSAIIQASIVLALNCRRAAWKYTCGISRTLNFSSPSHLNSFTAPISPLTSSSTISRFCPSPSPSSTLVVFLHHTIMLSSLEGRYIKLEVHADFWTSLDASPELSVEIRASFEADRMLCNRGVIGKLETSWDALLDHGNEPFDISFPPVDGVHPSLTLKAGVLHSCDNQDSALLDSIVECEIARETDAGQERIAKYVTSKTISHLNDAIQHFQLALDRCLGGYPDCAGALTNLAWARLRDYDLQDIDCITFLFRKALALCLQGYPDHALSICHLIDTLIWRYKMENFIAIYIHESALLCCKLLPLYPEGTYLRSIVVGVDSVDFVIRECNNLPVDASHEGIHLRRVVLELCPLGNEHHPNALNELAWALITHFEQYGSIDDLDECIQCRRKIISLCSEGDSEHDSYLNNLVWSLWTRFTHQGKYHDLNDAICLYKETLRPVEHKDRNSSQSSPQIFGAQQVSVRGSRFHKIQHRKLTEQWGAVVAETRDLKGLSRFLLPSSYGELQAAARRGPVIILIMMKKRVTLSFVAIGQGQPCTGKSKELLAVDSELELVRKLVPATANCTTISGDAATRAGALRAMQENKQVHLACHGKQDREQPHNSHFVMKDKPITLLDIMEKDIPHAEFAFLSACHTIVGDEETPDEVIHLAAGLQFSVFKSVIGTLWEVDDAVAKHVDLEDGGVMDCTKAAWALNRATHAVKTKVPLEQRMVFIHVGFDILVYMHIYKIKGMRVFHHNDNNNSNSISKNKEVVCCAIEYERIYGAVHE